MIERLELTEKRYKEIQDMLMQQSYQLRNDMYSALHNRS